MKVNVLFAGALVSLLVATATNAQPAGDSDAVFLWSSTGGGWRAMVACIGFANLFQQAGLFTADSSLMKAIATNSGASWFLVQMFYSPEFYEQVVMGATPDDIYDFTVTWMTSYYDLADSATKTVDAIVNATVAATNATFNEDGTVESYDPVSTTANFSALLHEDDSLNQFEFNPVVLLAEFYDLIVAANASWGVFVEEMLVAGVESVGHQGDFASTMATAEGRLSPLQNTDMLIQSTLAPDSKLRMASANENYTELASSYGDVNLVDEWAYLAPIFGDVGNQDMAAFLGPLQDEATAASTSIEDWQLYTVGLPAYYTVNSTYAGFQYGAFDSGSSTKLAAYASPTSPAFAWEDWVSYYLWPNENFWEWPTPVSQSVMGATIAADANQMAQNMTPSGTFRDPFGGGPASVIQVAAISSAFAGPVSPSQPAVFSQTLSLQRDSIRNALPPGRAVLALSAFDIAAGLLFNNPLADNVAICSQWPEPCGPTDGYFLDGAFSDNPSVAINIASYQHSEGADLSKTIKLVLTNTNQAFEPNSYDTQQILQYFSTDFNQDIAPGDYVWLPDFVSPYRSPEIFAEELSDEAYVASIEPIEGINMTTAIVRGTTIANPAYGTVAGQTVEILVLNTNAPITTFIAGREIINATIVPLADMSRKIAGNAEMLRRVQDFFELAPSNEEPSVPVTTTEDEPEAAQTSPPDTEEVSRGPEITGPTPLESSGAPNHPWIFYLVTVATWAFLLHR